MNLCFPSKLLLTWILGHPLYAYFNNLTRIRNGDKKNLQFLIVNLISYVNFGTPFIYISLDNLTRINETAIKKKFTIFNRVFSIKIISYVNFGTPFICVSLDNLTRIRNGDKKNLQFLIVNLLSISYVNFGTPFICVSLDNLTRTRNGDKKKIYNF